MLPLIPIGLALALLQGPSSQSSGVEDGAGLFSDSVVARARESLRAIDRSTGWQVAIKTVDSLDGKDIEQECKSQAKRANIHGLFLLFSKRDKQFYTVASASAARAFPPEAIKAVTDAIASAFRRGEFDDGLKGAIAKVREFAVARPLNGAPIGVRDKAKMFAPEAVVKADEALQALDRESSWQVVVETLDSLGGQPIQVRAEADAAASGVRGLFVLIAKADRKVFAVPSRSASRVFTKEKIDSLIGTLQNDFRARKFDQGLLDAVAQIRTIARPPGPVAATPARGGAGSASPPAQASSPSPAEAPNVEAPARSSPEADPAGRASSKPIPEVKSNLPLYLGIGVAAIAVLWILSRAFRQPRTAAYGESPPIGQPTPPQPSPPAQGYGPPPAPAQAGYGPPQPSAPPPGYGPRAGYGPPPGYAPGGYGPPQQPAAGGGGFLSGALGGIGGAIAGNILYDKFGRPHPDQGGGHHHEGHTAGSAGYVPPPPASSDFPAPPPQETYSANEGGGGGWDAPAPAPRADDEWAGQGEAATGGGWAQPEPASAGAEGSWAEPEPEPGEGGSWGEPEPASAGEEGSWGEPATEESPASDWSSPELEDTGGGGDWGGDAPDADQGQGGGW